MSRMAFTPETIRVYVVSMAEKMYGITPVFPEAADWGLVHRYIQDNISVVTGAVDKRNWAYIRHKLLAYAPSPEWREFLSPNEGDTPDGEFWGRIWYYVLMKDTKAFMRFWGLHKRFLEVLNNKSPYSQDIWDGEARALAVWRGRVMRGEIKIGTPYEFTPNAGDPKSWCPR